MTREEHIYQLKQYLQGKSISMCPASSLYWQEHWEEVIKALEQEPILDKIRTEIAEYGSIWVQYQITGRSDKDIQQLVTDVLKQAKEQVLDVIDKYKAETEE